MDKHMAANPTRENRMLQYPGLHSAPTIYRPGMSPTRFPRRAAFRALRVLLLGSIFVSGDLVAQQSKSGASRRSAAPQAKPATATSAASKAAEVARLVKELGHTKFVVAYAARDRLVEIGPSAFSAVRPALDSDDPRVRELAARVMEGYGDGASAAVPQLLRNMIQDEGSQAGANAGMALAAVGPSAAQHVPLLVEHYQKSSERSNDRRTIVRALANIGAAGRKDLPAAVPMLIADFTNYHPDNQNRIATILGVSRDPRALVFLDSALMNIEYSPDREDRVIGLALLEHGGAGIAVLDRAFASDNPVARRGAAVAFAAMGDPGLTRVAKVLEDTRDCPGYSATNIWPGDDACREQVLFYLKKANRAPAALLPALKTTLRTSRDHTAQDLARELIAEIEN